MASRNSSTIGVKVDHTAIAAATAAAAQHELKRAGALGERMLRIWQYAIGDETVREHLQDALGVVEDVIGIDEDGNSTKAADADEPRSSDSGKSGEWV